MYSQRFSQIAILFFCFLAATIGLLLTSSSTSPLFDFPLFYGDSAVFQIIGKYWVQGKLPYIDLWDLKGPVIFAINALGYWLTGDNNGVFIVQVIFLTAALYLAYSWVSRFASNFWSIVLTSILLFHTVSLGGRGNTIGEYCLPLLLLCFYRIFIWLHETEQSKEKKHDWRWTLFYGGVFAFCALSRLTNALGLFGAILFVSGTLIVAKQWKNLLYNALAFSLGFLFVLLPFVLYFYHFNALYELWYGTIAYNLEYAQPNAAQSVTFIKALQDCFIQRPYLADTALLLFFSCLIAFFLPSRRHWGILGLSIGIPISLWLANSHQYDNYGQIAIPQLPLVFFFAATLLSVFRHRWKWLFLPLFLWNTYPFAALLKQQLRPIWEGRAAYQYDQEELEVYRAILRLLPSAEPHSIVGYNLDPTFYLQENILPAIPYFNAQDFEIDKGASLYPRVYTYIRKNPPRFLIVIDKPTHIESLLSHQYTLLYEVYIDPPPQPAVYCVERPTLLRLYQYNNHTNSPSHHSE